MGAVLSLVCLLAIASPPPQVSEQQVNGVFDITGVITLPPAITEAQAFGVLSDYGHLANFVTSIRKSEIKTKTEHGATVEQVAQGKWFLFSRSASVLLEIHEVPPHIIIFHDLSHQDFTRYEGSWTLTMASGAVRIEYRLEAQPSAPVPAFVIEKVFQSDAAELLEQVRDEMIRRANSQPTGAKP